MWEFPEKECLTHRKGSLHGIYCFLVIMATDLMGIME